MANPLDFYRELRNESPVHYLPQYDTWVVTRFQDAWDVLGDVEGAFISTEGTLPTRAQLSTHNTGALPDPPMHPIGNANSFGSPVYEQFRQAQGRPLRPGAVAKLEGMLREVARVRLDELIPKGEFDLVQEYGGYVSATAVCYLLGLKPEQARQVLEVVNSSTVTHESAEDVGLNLVDLLDKALTLLRPAVEKQRAQWEAGEKTDGPVLNGLFDLEFQGRALADPEVTRNLICIFVGGTETVPKVTAHGLWELLKHPDQLAEVREDLARNVTIAREEFLRFCAPAQWFARTVRKETTIAGTPVHPGQRVIVSIASASRDEREFANPEDFVWNREIDRSLSFGRGQHFCIGFHLARLEVALLAEEFLLRAEKYSINPATAVRHPSSFQWGYNRLPVRVEA